MTPDEKQAARHALWEKGVSLERNLQLFMSELMQEARAPIQNEIEEEDGRPTFAMQAYDQGLRTAEILVQISAGLQRAEEYRQDCWSLATGLSYQDLAKDFKLSHGIRLPGYEEAREPDWTPPDIGPLCQSRYNGCEFDDAHRCIHCGEEF